MEAICVGAMQLYLRTGKSKADISRLFQFFVSKFDFLGAYSVVYIVNTKDCALGEDLLEFFAAQVLNPAPSEPLGVKGIHSLAAVAGQNHLVGLAGQNLVGLAGHHPVSRAGTRGRYRTPKAWTSEREVNVGWEHLPRYCWMYVGLYSRNVIIKKKEIMT